MTKTIARMRGIRFLLLAFCGAVLAAPALAASSFDLGDPVDFRMKSTTREIFSADDLEGKLVVVSFWATISEPCLEMIPQLRDLNERYHDQGVVMISVSVDRDTQAAKGVIREHGMDWINVLNNEQPQKPNRLFFSGGYGVPHAFLISPEGNLLWEGHSALLEAQIENALENHPPDLEAAVELGARPAVTDAHEIAKKAARAAFTHDFKAFFKQIELLPEDAYNQAKVKASGRSVKRYVQKYSAEQQENYQLYRTTYPETAAALDAWIAASDSSISDIDDNAPPADPRRVEMKFKQAEAAQARGDDIKAYDLYRWIVSRAPNSDEAILAEDFVLTFESDPQSMARLEASKTQEKANNLMNMAKNYNAAGMDEKAQEVFRKIINEFPDTQAAKEAAEKLGR